MKEADEDNEEGLFIHKVTGSFIIIYDFIYDEKFWNGPVSSH